MVIVPWLRAHFGEQFSETRKQKWTRRWWNCEYVDSEYPSIINSKDVVKFSFSLSLFLSIHVDPISHSLPRLSSPRIERPSHLSQRELTLGGISLREERFHGLFFPRRRRFRVIPARLFLNLSLSHPFLSRLIPIPSLYILATVPLCPPPSPYCPVSLSSTFPPCGGLPSVATGWTRCWWPTDALPPLHCLRASEIILWKLLLVLLRFYTFAGTCRISWTFNQARSKCRVNFFEQVKFYFVPFVSVLINLF